MRPAFPLVSAARSLKAAVLAILLPGGLAAALTITTPATITLPTGTNQYALTATGGTGNLSWSVVSGTLPPGIALRTDTPSFFNATTQQAGLIGVATAPGTYNFTVKVTDSASTPATDTRALSLKITAFNFVSGSGIPDVFLNVNYPAATPAFQFATINAAAGGTLSYSVTPGYTLPAGLNLSATGALTGTPTAAGNYSFFVRATDGTDTVDAFFNLSVYSVQITTPGVLSATANQNGGFSQQLSATGSGSITWSATNGYPSGLSLSASGLLSATNVNAGPGVYSIGVKATDSTNASYTKTFILTVIGTSPQLLGISNPGILEDATVGDRYSAGFTTCCGGTGGAVTWTATGLPAGMSIRFGEGTVSSNYNPGTAELVGIPQTAGSYTINLTATGGGQSVSILIPFKVGVLSAQTISNGTLGVNYNQPVRILGGTSPYSAALAPGVQILPNGVTLTATPPAVVGNPPNENGFFNPFVTYTDSTAGTPATLTRRLNFSISNVTGSTGVSINNANDLGTALLNTSYSLTLSASGTSPFTWTTSSTLPAGLTLSTGGVLSGSPTAVGTYTFLVKLTDNTAKTAFKQFRLVVTGLSITTANTLPYGNAGSTYTIPALVATGGSGTQTWVLAPGSSLPPGMTLSAAGLLSGTPTSTGLYNFTVNVTDTGGNFASRVFNVSFYPAGSAPPLIISTAAALGDFKLGTLQLQLIASGGNGTYTWSAPNPAALPPGMALRTDLPTSFSTTAQAGLIGVANTPGSYSFTLIVTSGSQTASQTFTINIHSLAPQESYVPAAYVGQPFTFQFTPVGASGAVTFTPDSTLPLPSSMTMDSTGKITGTPTVAGGTSFRFTMTDNNGPIKYTYNFNVSALQFTNNLQLPGATQGQTGYSAQVTATGGTGAITYSTTSLLPSGLTLNSSTGVISGTVASNAGIGPNSLIIKATDSAAPPTPLPGT